MTPTPRAYINIEAVFAEDVEDYVSVAANGSAWVVEGSRWVVMEWGVFGNQFSPVESLIGDCLDNYLANFAPDIGPDDDIHHAIQDFCDRSDWQAQAQTAVDTAVEAILRSHGAILEDSKTTVE